MWHNIQNVHKPMWQSRMDIQKTQATWGKKYRTKTNRGGNHEWTIQIHRQHVAHYTEPRLTELAIKNGHSKTQATCGTLYRTKTNRGGNHEWRIQRHRQHVAQYTEPRLTELAIKNGQSKDTGNMWHNIQSEDKPRWQSRMDNPKTQATCGHNIQNENKPRWQSRMDNPKTQATCGTIYRTKTNRGGNQEWTFQRHRQHMAQYTARRPTEVAIKNGQCKDTGKIWHNV